MSIHGEIKFKITDSNDIEVDMEAGIDLAIKLTKKGQYIALNTYAPKNIWSCGVKFFDHHSFDIQLKMFTDQLMTKYSDIQKAICTYESVSVEFFIRSEFGQMGYSLPGNILKELSKLGININFHILSFGFVESDVLDKDCTP